jgi:hypothetical protein
MTTRDAIHQAAQALGMAPPKVTEYTNSLAVAFRNAEGDRIVVLIDHDAPDANILSKLKAAYTTKATSGAMSTHDMLKRIKVPKPEVRYMHYTDADKLTVVKEPFTPEQRKAIDCMIDAKIEAFAVRSASSRIR